MAKCTNGNGRAGRGALSGVDRTDWRHFRYCIELPYQSYI